MNDAFRRLITPKDRAMRTNYSGSDSTRRAVDLTLPAASGPLPFPDLPRVGEGTGTRIEPPFDRSWPDLIQLQWQAAVARVDSGLQVMVSESNYSIGGRRQYGYYDVSIVGYSTCGPESFQQAWYKINAIIMGARAVKAAAEAPPPGPRSCEGEVSK